MNLTNIALYKQSPYRPGQALRFPEVWGSQISRQLAHAGGKVVSPAHRLALFSRKYSRYSFLSVTLQKDIKYLSLYFKIWF
jgi:hypothetical protein